MESFNENNKTVANIGLSSIVQNAKHDTLSKRYNFLDTKVVLGDMAELGWLPVKAQQKAVRKPEYEGFQLHTIMLANKSLETSSMTTLPRLTLKNGHDGKTPIEFLISLFEKVCANGLFVASHNFENMRFTHVQYNQEDLRKAITASIKNLSGTLEVVEDMKQLTLDKPERLKFAKKAIEMTFDGEKYSVKPEEMLYNHRLAQKEPTLWNTYNTIQEHIIRGGVRQQRSDGTRIRSRGIGSINRNIKVNKNLWTLAEEYLN